MQITDTLITGNLYGREVVRLDLEIQKNLFLLFSTNHLLVSVELLVTKDIEVEGHSDRDIKLTSVFFKPSLPDPRGAN